MRAASRRLTHAYDEIMAPSGLRFTQFNLLCELERHASNPPSVSELADLLTMERSALGQTLRPLERAGMLELGRDERDGRRRPILLTTKGRTAIANTQPYWEQAHYKFIEFFGIQATEGLRGTLRDIAEDPRLDEIFHEGQQGR
ncbi:MarR family winged helix-turn-helix transcriptional regulator [Paraburkholderia sp. C35]|uniref:MarR family winged helix-turn-helix transcriptional regulator n=1 Tax=Paraburkholderia sp. C35 TaxID=2126993 RepID=UPI0013A5600B|nr:MarR family winged helix-turn-helix transcriptional regulator [Paraburkholderia sp. C35]